jgi:hypothetical protein|nr:MAG TPA: transcriptional repressor [Caudoviricetes sp.]
MNTKKQAKEMSNKKSANSSKVWQLNNKGYVQASVVLTIDAAATLTECAEKLGIRPLDYMANILEAYAAKKGRK